MVQIKNLKIGEGMPKICVSVMEADAEAISNSAAEILKNHVDIVEWRMDFLEVEDYLGSITDVLLELKKILRDIPVLCTFRTKAEGGNRELEFAQYDSVLRFMADSGLADLIDVEVCKAEPARIKELVTYIQSKNCKVVGSFHDFSDTPSQKEIVERIMSMKELGVDIPKIAVMPKDRKDVQSLLNASIEASERLGDTPLITMSMGRLGMVSRLAGEFTGSAVTFGCVGKASAPGQIEVNRLRDILELLAREELS